MKKSKLIALILALTLVLSPVAGCSRGSSNGPTQTYDNEEDFIVFSSQELDGVFNPFFSTSAADANVIGPTQISMIGNDRDGNYVYGDDEDVVVKDFQLTDNGKAQDNGLQTTYAFVLKNNVRFSNGSYLTMKDVLFNLYVYLDPVYSGSSTIYSTDIVGLKEYRTQKENEKEQDSFMSEFNTKANTRISTLRDEADAIWKEDPTLDEQGMRGELEKLQTENATNEAYKHLVEDYDKMCELFRKELANDFSNSRESYETTVFQDSNGVEYKNQLKSDVEMFLYNENAITWNKKEHKLEYGVGADTLDRWNTLYAAADTRDKAMDEAIDFVYGLKVPGKTSEILTYWVTAGDLFTYIANSELEESYKGQDRRYKNISGIKFANREAAYTVNGVEYPKVEYDETTGQAKTNEVLTITINNVDPKAIWNFSFAVAPMYYYSDAAHIAAFDYVSNFGVEYGSQTFMETVVNNIDKIGVPVGAGPYAASKSSGGITGITAGDFRSLGVVYYERNPYYLMGPAKIKKMRYQVVPEAQMLNSLYNRTVTFVEPNAKPETINELNAKKDQGFNNQTVRTSGYGYIGINAGKVPSIKVRQAIMHCINTQECVDYYSSKASAIYRSMSMSNWAYPKGCEPYYPYVGGPVPENLEVVNPDYADYVTKLGKKAGEKLTEKEQEDFIRSLVEGAGYSPDSNGVYTNSAGRLKYDFTVVGDTTDHPAWMALYHAQELLNKWGFEITTKNDRDGLTKLGTGSLAIWAAAWGSTIDPDMYQVYHKDSTASSVLNWGYRQILQNTSRYQVENRILNELSTLIEEARETNDQEVRTAKYKDALDLVMELAVELPTYQRDDLFAYDAWKLDSASLTQNPSPYMGLTSKLYNVSLITER